MNQSNETGVLVEARSVEKTFKRGGDLVRAVSGVSLTIASGETVGLIGESGSGKTTLGRVVLGLLAPDEGEIVFEGQSLSSRSGEELRVMRAKMQVVFQEPYASLNPRLRIRSIIAEPLIVQGVAKTEWESRVAEALDQVGLPQAFASRFPGELSGGQQQRVGIARAVVGRPKFVVLDEPTASLDRTIRRQITDLLMQLQRDLNLAYLLITHDIASVRRMAVRSLVLFRGHLVEAGPTAAVLSAPGHPYTRGLVSAELPPRPGARRERFRLNARTIGAPVTTTGCPLLPVCPLAIEECSAAVPPLLDMGSDHGAACIRWRDVAAASASPSTTRPVADSPARRNQSQTNQLNGVKT